MVWKIGPACVAQQAKNVRASTMNGAETSASATRTRSAVALAAPPASATGVGRTNSAAGISSAQTSKPMINCALRQSCVVSSQAASGERVSGATPMPTAPQPYLRFMPIVVRGPARSTSAMQLARAPGEGVHHGVGDLVEERLEQPCQRAARELVAHRILDLAGVLAERREAPGGAELAERPLDEAHVDGAARLALVFGREALADPAHPDGQRRALARAA